MRDRDYFQNSDSEQQQHKAGWNNTFNSLRENKCHRKISYPEEREGHKGGRKGKAGRLSHNQNIEYMFFSGTCEHL